VPQYYSERSVEHRERVMCISEPRAAVDMSLRTAFRRKWHRQAAPSGAARAGDDLDEEETE
jgi:hypothetical protein